MDELGNYEPKREFAKRLRRERTLAEWLLWKRLQGSKVGFKFSQQIYVGEYCVDFCCRSRRLVIELDGIVHEGQEDWDRKRESEIRALGYEVIRFSNDRVHSNMDFVVAEIIRACEARPQWRY